MIGTIANVCTIIIGSVIGSILKRGLGEKYQRALFVVCGLAAVAVGVNAVVTYMPDSNYPVLFIASLAIGAVVGTALNIDGRFQSLVNRHSKSNLGEGLSTGILIYCIGTLSIIGPVTGRRTETTHFCTRTQLWISSHPWFSRPHMASVCCSQRPYYFVGRGQST